MQGSRVVSGLLLLIFVSAAGDGEVHGNDFVYASHLHREHVVTIKTPSRVTPFQFEIRGHQVFFG